MNGLSHRLPHPSGRLEGKVAIITGGASGIGEATARLFVLHGAAVIIGDVQDQLARSLCADLAPAASFVHCDITSESDVKTLVDAAIERHGRLDIMFNNAGVGGDGNGPIVECDNGNFRRVFDVNVYGAFLGAKQAARVMIPAGRGVILFTASLASVVAGEASHAYTVSKHAVVGLTKSLCVDLGQHGIRVNCISPCAMATPMLNAALGMDTGRVEELAAAAGVLKRAVGRAEDAAEAAAFLASDEARYVSGLNFILDGGYSTTNRAFSAAIQKSRR